MPGALGDPLVALGHRLSAAGFEQEEVAVLVDRLAAEAEVPVDHLYGSMQHQLAQARFLRNLAARRLRGRFARLEMTFGKSPVAVRVADQQVVDLAVRGAAEDDATSGRLALRAALAFHGQKLQSQVNRRQGMLRDGRRRTGTDGDGQGNTRSPSAPGYAAKLARAFLTLPSRN